MGFSKVSVAVGLMLMVVVSDRPAVVEGAIRCPEVRTLLRSCVGYVKLGKTPVPPACCRGVRSLNNMAKSTADRRTACSCIKQAAGLVNKVNYRYVNSLPGKCGVRIRYTISSSINCSKVT